MEFSDSDPTFRLRFLTPKFEPDDFVQSIASKSIGSVDLMNMKRRMYLIASEAKTELKQNVYRNHTKFIDTAKEVSSLESEVYQLHSLLADEKSLLNTVKELLNVEDKSGKPTTSSDSDSWELLVRHCESLGLVSSNSDRRLLYSGKLFEVKSEVSPKTTIAKSPLPTSSYVTHQCYGLLFTDCFIIAKSSNIRTATAYDVDQVFKFTMDDKDSNKQHQQIQISNIKDDQYRNAFCLKHNMEVVTLLCDSSQSKKTWLEWFESVLYPKQRRGSLLYTDSDQISAVHDKKHQSSLEEDFYNDEWVTNTTENLTILLAERNFDQALNLILKARTHSSQFQQQQNQQQTLPFIDEYLKSIKGKEQELCKLIEKEIYNICERGCSMINSIKHYYHHIQILKKLGYISKACDLFIYIQNSLMNTTLKQTKLEELNVVYVENYSSTFFTRLAGSYYEFIQIFKDNKSTFSKFIVWITNEIEKLIKILRNQHYIGSRNFGFTMKNIEILLLKANDFSIKLIDVKFLFEEYLEQVLISTIKDQKDLIIDTLRQRHREEKWTPINLQTNERLEQLYYEFHELGLDSKTFLQDYVIISENGNVSIDLAPSTLQFSKAYLLFSRDIYKIHYTLINQTIVEALVELIKLHLKYYERALLQTQQMANDKQNQQLKLFILKNVDFSLNHLFHYVDNLYRPKIGNSVKFFTKVYDKLPKLQEMAS
ncbi:unnamed protein product [Didymodactylos carnosus]|uniref:Exocyst complex component 8 n=1 Tax=Didymodactylos carnosus TaxID=1234261 RepID=A0A814L5T1_9BILA|nr:unnamed protein product [Didymodactylos carnosus]CAF3828329.1 unnamed protein product [Didymodactylos carnosus]